MINNKVVNIDQITSFSQSKENSINIAFTTIQDLHNQFSFPRENGLTIEDIKSQKIVLISDEAHHINVETKRKSKKANSTNSTETELTGGSWESTVDKILNANDENILLEFTATMDLENSGIYEKYTDIVFDYPLREFRKDGYSKEVSVEVFDSKIAIERAITQYF